VEIGATFLRPDVRELRQPRNKKADAESRIQLGCGSCAVQGRYTQ
jgi:hypothetical protein